MAFRYNPGGQLTGSNKEEESRAAEHSRRLAKRLLLGEDISMDGIYPDDVDPYLHRYDHEATEHRGLDDV